MQEVNPEKPYWYRYFHGWKFTPKGPLCKKMCHAFYMDKFHTVNLTSITLHGNASVEPAYKSWLLGSADSVLQHCPPAVPQMVAVLRPTTTITIDDLDSNHITPTTTSDDVPTLPITIQPVPSPPHTALNTTYASWSASPTPTIPP